MAYSDYGGYAYRNGVRVEERSDATITPKGDTYGTPGSYPGFALLAAGMPADEVQKRIEWPSGHAVLGDGPIYVVLYKQMGTSMHRGPEKMEMVDLLVDAPAEAISSYMHAGETVRYIDTDHFVESGGACTFKVDGYTLEVFYREEDNYYQYARFTQPDGTVWHGWSGYGVGAGLEDCGYGYSTQDREDMLWELFPIPTEVTSNPI